MLMPADIFRAPAALQKVRQFEHIRRNPPRLIARAWPPITTRLVYIPI
jgi:hypothetical protein